VGDADPAAATNRDRLIRRVGAAVDGPGVTAAQLMADDEHRVAARTRARGAGGDDESERGENRDGQSRLHDAPLVGLRTVVVRARPDIGPDPEPARRIPALWLR